VGWEKMRHGLQMRDSQDSRKKLIREKVGKYPKNNNLRLLAPTYYARYTEVLKMIEKSGSILDVGCADGFYSRAIADKNNRVIGMDTNIDYLDKERQFNNPLFLVANGENLNFRDEVFDAILCIDVIEHVDNDEQALSEIYRVLKPGGQLVISVPNYNFPFTYDIINFMLKRFNKHLPIGIWGFGHKRIYSFEHLKSLLEKYKFNIAQTRYLTHDFAAFFENYLSTIFGWVAVREKKGGHRADTSSRVRRFIYQCGYNITKTLNSVDNRLFDNISRSVGMAISARKVIGH
jgi:SAM-dependent methyltransferase